MELPESKATFRVNGKSYTSRRRSQRNVTPQAPPTVTPQRLIKGDYWVEKLVGYMALTLLMAAGIRLAIISAYGDMIMMAGQCVGFVASTIFIARLKYKLGKGDYHGRQRRVGEKLFYSGVLLEGFTLLAKFFPVIIPAYLFTIVFTIPGLIIASFNIVYLDRARRLDTLRKENESLRVQLREERALLIESSSLKKELATLRAKEKTEDNRNDEMQRQASKNKGKIKRLAKTEYALIVGGIEKDIKVKKTAAKQLTVGEKHSRSTKGPSNNPKNVNRRKCKNPACDNYLTGRQRTACSSKCRTAISRL